jgi:6-phosphogluconolactonase
MPADRLSCHRLEGELKPTLAAKRYEDLLRRHFPQPGQSTFDLLLLGMGDDGHTASLFPDTAAVIEENRWVLGYYVEHLASWRLTLTSPVLNHARNILFMVTGETKADTLSHVLTGKNDPRKYPAQVINPTGGELLWLVDRAAASLLPNRFTG